MAELMAMLGGADDLYMETIRENLEHRVLILNREINESVIEDYITYILKWNKEDKGLSAEMRKPIKIYINSLGGCCFNGFNLVNVILASKTKIIGVAFGLTASMGYHIFLACHERIAFIDSVLLQHDGEIAIQNSASKAKDTMRFFDNMESRTKDYVLSRTTMTEEFYDNHYDQEYYMYANEQGKEFGIVHKVIGEDCDIDYIL